MVLVRVFSLENSFSYSFCSHRRGGSKVDLGLTWSLGLNIRVARRAPEVHPRACDV